MGRKDRKPAKASSPKKAGPSDTSDGKPVPLWKRPLIWIWGIILPALAAALSVAFQAQFTSLINVFTPEPPPFGDPITAVASLTPKSVVEGVSLPRPQALSDQDLESLRGMSSEQQIRWLQENREGIPIVPYELKMDLKSNRPYTVRLTDIRPVGDCKEPTRGSLVKTVHWGTGMATGSILFRLFVDRPDEGPIVNNPGKNPEPFFPSQTITLSGEQRDYLVLQLEPSKTTACSPELDLTIVDGDEEVHQRISPDGQVPLMPFLEARTFESDYSSVYLAGGICKRPVLAPESYHADAKKSDVEAACGPGNLGPELMQPTGGNPTPLR